METFVVVLLVTFFAFAVHHFYITIRKNESNSDDDTDREEKSLYKRLISDGCVDCGGRKFLEGPSAGLSTNIKCEKCETVYNVTPMVNFAEYIGK